MILRLAGLALLDAAVVVCAWFGLPAGGTLLVHLVLTCLGLATWLRGGGAPGFVPAILGMLGPVALLLALPFARFGGRVRAPADLDALLGIRPAHATHRGASLKVARMLDGRVLHAPPEALSSLVTVMRHGDVAARRGALETVVRSFQPALSPLVALALTDADQTIRALAAASAARVAQNLASGRAALEARVADGDPAARALLAELLADHARGDVLLSDSQRSHLRDDAVALLDADAHDTMRFEALWAAGDYDGLDRLAGSIPGIGAGRQMANWWRTESLA